jgi:hypothetical protein
MADETELVTLPEDPSPAAETEVVIDEKKAKKAEKSEAPKVETADDGVRDLQKQVERARAEAAERLRAKDREIQETYQRAVKAEQEVVTVKKDAVGSVIDSLKKDQEAASRDYKIAMEKGDYEAAADAQVRISNASAEIVAAKRGQMELEEQAKRPVQQPIAPINDVVEHIASSLSERAADWVRKHPEVARDKRKWDRAIRADQDARDDGIPLDSDEYFSFIESRLGIGSPAAASKSEGREASRAPVAAPVGRDLTQAPGSDRPGVVRLTASQARAARETLQPLYPDKSDAEILQIYARNMQQLRDEGKIGRVQ